MNILLYIKSYKNIRILIKKPFEKNFRMVKYTPYFSVFRGLFENYSSSKFN